MNLLLSFNAKTCTNKCRRLTEKLKVTCHRNIAQEVNTRLQEADEEKKQYYKIIIDITLTTTYKPEPYKNKNLPKYIFPADFTVKVWISYILKKL